jgi:hypothetical protein
MLPYGTIMHLGRCNVQQGLLTIIKVHNDPSLGANVGGATYALSLSYPQPE